jgi:hypothetical protein
LNGGEDTQQTQSNPFNLEEKTAHMGVVLAKSHLKIRINQRTPFHHPPHHLSSLNIGCAHARDLGTLRLGVVPALYRLCLTPRKGVSDIVPTPEFNKPQQKIYQLGHSMVTTLLSKFEIYNPRNAPAPASLLNLKYNFPKQKYKILKSKRKYKWDRELYIFL